MSVSVTEETVTSNVEISTEGSLKVKKLVSENGEDRINAKKALTIEEDSRPKEMWRLKLTRST